MSKRKEKKIKDLPFAKSKMLGKVKQTQDYSDKIKEDVLQRQCEEYLKIKNVPFLRIPDWIYKLIFSSHSKISPRWRKFVSEYLKGKPDLFIFKKEGANLNLTLCVELKSEKGKMTQGQKNFADRVNVIVVRSFGHFQKLVDGFVK